MLTEWGLVGALANSDDGYSVSSDVPKSKKEILQRLEKIEGVVQEHVLKTTKANWKSIYKALQKDYAWCEAAEKVGKYDGYEYNEYNELGESIEDGKEFKNAFSKALHEYPTFKEFME